jgi:hypothetical protein
MQNCMKKITRAINEPTHVAPPVLGVFSSRILCWAPPPDPRMHVSIGPVHPAYNPYFSVEIVFFSHNKSANSVFQPAYQHSRTWPM